MATQQYFLFYFNNISSSSFETYWLVTDEIKLKDCSKFPQKMFKSLKYKPWFEEKFSSQEKA